MDTYSSIMSKFWSVHITTVMALPLILESTEQLLLQSVISKQVQLLKIFIMAVSLVVVIFFPTEVIPSSSINVSLLINKIRKRISKTHLSDGMQSPTKS